MAQQVLVSPPEHSPVAPAAQSAGTIEAGAVPSETAASFPSAGRNLFQWGPVHLRPHLDYRFLYGDGIHAQPNQATTTVIHTISPGLLFDIGRHWSLDYTPSLRYYSSDRFRDTTDHSVTLDGRTSYLDWILGLAHNSSLISDPLIETGRQTDQETHSTALSATHLLNSKMSLDLGLNQNFRSAEQFTSSRAWSTMDWLNYQFWPRFGAGIGAGFGYIDVNAGSDMTYEQYQGRLSWQPVNKISLAVNGGVEDRQFLDSDAPDLINPIFGTSITYRLFEQTILSLSANRAVSVSYFRNQAFEKTALTAGLQQRLFGKLHLGVQGGCSTTEYVATSDRLSVNRSDDYTYVGAQLSCAFLKKGTIGIFFQHSENTSNESGFGYSSDQGGVRIGYHF